ncbi:MAG: HNH endonuclease [bacterium]|nr:HNH endonuclease [bacterium]
MSFSTHDFSIEHIVPIQKGGESTLDNLALACQGCNNFKFTRGARRQSTRVLPAGLIGNSVPASPPSCQATPAKASCSPETISSLPERRQ